MTTSYEAQFVADEASLRYSLLVLQEQVERLLQEPSFIAEQESNRLAALEEFAVQTATQQYRAGYVRLPVVPKQIMRSPKGALYYINPLGNRIYLKKRQKEMCMNGTLKGTGDTCPAPV